MTTNVHNILEMLMYNQYTMKRKRRKFSIRMLEQCNILSGLFPVADKDECVGQGGSGGFGGGGGGNGGWAWGFGDGFSGGTGGSYNTSFFGGGGVFERHPKLRVGFMEAGVTWVPYFLDRLHEHWEKRIRDLDPDLEPRPSEFLMEFARERRGDD